METSIEIDLRSTNVRKATDKDELPRRFLKCGLQVSSKPTSELCNHFIKSGRFTDSCKISKLKSFSKERSKVFLIIVNIVTTFNLQKHRKNY